MASLTSQGIEPSLEWDTPTYRLAVAQLDHAAARMRLDPNIWHPRSLSPAEKQRVTRRYTSEIIEVIGPDRDIPAPDLGTDEQVMAWIMDPCSQQKGHAVEGERRRGVFP